MKQVYLGPAEPFDRGLIDTIQAVYTEMFQRVTDSKLAVELTSIYFSVPVTENVAVTHDEPFKLYQANREKDQVIESLTKQVIELKSRLDRANLIAEMREFHDFDTWMKQRGEGDRLELKGLWDDYRW